MPRLLFILVVLLAPAVHATQIMEKCKGDAKRLCPGAEKSESNIIRCLVEHEDELGPECKVAHLEEKGKFLRTSPCGADIKKFCSTPPKEAKAGWVGTCLAGNLTKVSKGCQDYHRKLADELSKALGKSK